MTRQVHVISIIFHINDFNPKKRVNFCVLYMLIVLQTKYCFPWVQMIVVVLFLVLKSTFSSLFGLVFKSGWTIPCCFQFSLIFKIGNFIHCSSKSRFFPIPKSPPAIFVVKKNFKTWSSSEINSGSTTLLHMTPDK